MAAGGVVYDGDRKCMTEKRYIKTRAFEVRDTPKCTDINDAAGNGCRICFSTFFENYNEEEYLSEHYFHLLLTAFRGDDPSFYKIMIEKYGFDINVSVREDRYENLLISALYEGDTRLKELLELGCDPNKGYDDSFSPMKLALINEWEEEIRILLEYGANLPPIDKNFPESAKQYYLDDIKEPE